MNDERISTATIGDCSMSVEDTVYKVGPPFAIELRDVQFVGRLRFRRRMPNFLRTFS